MPHDHHDHDHEHAHHHDHDHSHGHGHHGHSHAPASFGAAFAIGLGANIAYIIGEAIWGILAHAMALLADAGHNLSDVLGMVAAWLAHSLARRAPSARYTYGLRRSTILSALGNACALLIVTGGIVWESLLRLWHPGPVQGTPMMIVAAIGIAVNGGTALLFASGSKNDINLRGVFTHMVADAMMAAAVVVTGLLITLTGLRILDPITSLVVSAIIIVSTWSLLRRSLDLALDAMPEGLDDATITQALGEIDGVEGAHHLHVWSLSTTETALTAHLRHDPLLDAQARDRLLESAAAMLQSRFKIGHATLQLESAPCAGPGCSPKAATAA